MFKKCLLILTTAGAIAIAAPFGAAQGIQSNDQTSQTANPAHEHSGRRHHDAPDPARRTAELTNRLSFTLDQQAKVLSALQSESSQMQSVRTATESQIRSVLDSNQQKEWDQVQARHGQRTENRSAAPDTNAGQQQATQ